MEELAVGGAVAAPSDADRAWKRHLALAAERRQRRLSLTRARRSVRTKRAVSQQGGAPDTPEQEQKVQRSAPVVPGQSAPAVPGHSAPAVPGHGAPGEPSHGTIDAPVLPGHGAPGVQGATALPGPDVEEDSKAAGATPVSHGHGLDDTESDEKKDGPPLTHGHELEHDHT